MNVAKLIRPSTWGMKAIDLIAVLIVIALLVKVFASGTGLDQAFHTGAHLLAEIITLIAGWFVQFLNWI